MKQPNRAPSRSALSAPAGPVAAGVAARAGIPGVPDRAAWSDLIDRALDEDLGCDPRGADPNALVERDLTTAVAVPKNARARGRLIAKAPGVLAGLPIFADVFRRFDPELRIEFELEDGAAVEPGQLVATLEGSARALLTAERTALNLLQRMSGVASLTARFVAAARTTDGRAVRVLDTRKTTPGMRLLQKYAVRCGGGENHRYGLYDEVMLKDNHADWSPNAAASPPRRLAELVDAARARYTDSVRITAEARDVEQAEAALRAGADVLLLDNFAADALEAPCAHLREVARQLGRAVELEASGGITLETIADYSRSGVDRVSVGALTHSARALDLSLEVEPLPAAVEGAQ